MVNAESTKEQVHTYVAALEQEKEGYAARAALAKAGKDVRLSEAELADRIKQIDAEIKRAKGLLSKGKKKDEDAEDAAA